MTMGRRHLTSRTSTPGSATHQVLQGHRAVSDRPRTRVTARHRPVRLRQVDLHPLPEPDARGRCPGRASTGQVLLDGEDLYAPGVDPVAGAAPGRHGVPEAEPVPHDVDLRQRGGRAPARRRARRSARSHEAVERALRQAALWDEVKDDLDKSGVEPLGRPAAAPLHRPRARGRARGAADGRAVLGARSRSPPRRSRS